MKGGTLTNVLAFMKRWQTSTLRLRSSPPPLRVLPVGDYRTPYEKLVSLDNWQQHLKEGITVDYLEQQARRMSDTECARPMQQRKRKLLASCRSPW